MNVYLESSAALRDLLEGSHARDIRDTVSHAKIVVVSALTLAEVGRIFARMRAVEPKVAAQFAAREAIFTSDTELWHVIPVTQPILTRCARPFPVEPVRTLDAIHLATLEHASSAVTGLVMISTDARVRENAVALGFKVFPN